MNPFGVTDPYFANISTAVVDLLRDTALNFEVNVYSGELNSQEAILKWASRVQMRPQILVRFNGGANQSTDSTFVMSNERLTFEVVVGVSNPRSVEEQFSVAVSGMGYARRKLVGQRVQGASTNVAPIKYDSWTVVTSDTGLTVLAVNFFIEPSVALDE